MKIEYTAPELEITEFDSEDVITTSLTEGVNAPDYGKGGDTISF